MVPFSQTRVLQSGGKTHKCPKTSLVPWELLALGTVGLLPLSLLELKFHVNRRHVRGMLATVAKLTLILVEKKSLVFESLEEAL